MFHFIQLKKVNTVSQFSRLFYTITSFKRNWNVHNIQSIEKFDSKAREWRHDSDKTQTNKPEWRTIFLKHFLKQPVFLKHIFETKTLPRFPLVLSECADVVWASWGI